MNETVFWIAFNAFIIIMLAIDLGVFQRKDHVIGLKESLLWFFFWVILALAFNVVVYYWRGEQKALEFLTGFLIEKSLSVDNLFVFIVIFSYFGVPKKYEHKVLFWGIFMTLVLRGIFIFAGVALFEAFHWMIYLFGGILLYTAIKMALFPDSEQTDLSNNFTVRMCRKLFPVSDHYHEGNFFTMENGRKTATPLFLVLMVIAFTDVLFAVDSIPAVLAITSDPFIVYTSNVFAILGLRAIYFALASLMPLFRFLKHGLSAILAFVGIKMLISGYYHIDTFLSLTIVVSMLALSMVLSLMFKKRK